MDPKIDLTDGLDFDRYSPNQAYKNSFEALVFTGSYQEIKRKSHCRNYLKSVSLLSDELLTPDDPPDALVLTGTYHEIHNKRLERNFCSSRGGCDCCGSTIPWGNFSGLCYHCAQELQLQAVAVDISSVFRRSIQRQQEQDLFKVVNRFFKHNFKQK